MSDELTPAKDETAPPAAPDGAPTPAATEPKAAAGITISRPVLYAAGILVAILVVATIGVYAWKAFSERSLAQQHEAERAELTAAQRQALSGQARDLLRLTARPLAWAVRAELLRDNLGQIDDYFREYVRERGVTSLMLVGKDGRIALATNRKLETQPAETLVSKPLLEATDVTVEASGTSLRLAVPVMSFDRRLGLLVLDYDLGAH